MADDTNIPPTADAAPVSAPPVVTKIKRAPRRSKAEMEAAAAKSAAAKSANGRNKQAAKAAETVPEAKTVAKRANDVSAAKPVAAKRGPNKPAPSAASGNSTIAELSELLQLEEENKKLRNALAEKLRAENADLRKRLGNG